MFRNIGMSNGCRPRRFAAGSRIWCSLVGGQRRHGQGFPARRLEDVIGVVAGDAHLPLGLLVVRLQVRVTDGPVFQRAARHRSVGGAHAEILLHVAPGLRAITERAAAHAGCVVAVAAFAGIDDPLALLVHQHARVAFLVGAERRCRAPRCAGYAGRPCGSRRPNTTSRVPAAPRSDPRWRVPWPPLRRPRRRRRSPH